MSVRKHLTEISRIMSDGYLFLKVMDHLEAYESKRKEDAAANQLCELVEQFSRLAKICSDEREEGKNADKNMET